MTAAGVEPRRPRHRNNGARQQLYNIYAEIDLTNDQESPGGGGASDMPQRPQQQPPPQLFPSVQGLASAGGNAAILPAHPPRHPPVPHLPVSARPSRTRTRAEVAEIMELQVSLY